MPDRITIPCEDGEVLEEHQSEDPRGVLYKSQTLGCWLVEDVMLSAQQFRSDIEGRGYEHALVFDSPEEAGRALARWVEQGRNVRWQGKDGSFPVLPHSRCAAGIVNALERRADAVRVDAPSAAALEPWVPSLSIEHAHWSALVGRKAVHRKHGPKEIAAVLCDEGGVRLWRAESYGSEPGDFLHEYEGAEGDDAWLVAVLVEETQEAPRPEVTT